MIHEHLQEPEKERLRTDLASWEIGPYHGALPAPMQLQLTLDGEVIVSARVETGFLHRGLEKTFELHLWQSAPAYADHLDPEGSVFGELALCMAVEEIARIDVPERAKRIRVILSELTRVTAHMGYVARIARSVGSDTMVHYVLRDREKVLDLFELLSGARFSVNFLRFGGVQADVTEGFIERVLEVCDLIRFRLKEYNDLLTFNHAFLKRTVGVGIIPHGRVHHYGITGPNARASGHSLDVRKVAPYSGYGRVDFEIPMVTPEYGNEGDIHARFLIRLREIAQSVEILRQEAEAIPKGDFSVGPIDKDFVPPAGEAYSRVESSRGLLGCHVVSDGGRSPRRIQFRPPTFSLLAAIPELVRGVRIEDLPVLLMSLDLGIAEADR